MSQPIPILLYHSIAPEAAPRFRRWVVRPEMFAAHMDYLRAQDYAPLTVPQLAEAMQQLPATLPARPVLVTFDDGFADFYIYALPVLQSLGFVATLYVTTGFVGAASQWLWRLGEGERAMLTWAQLRQVCACGIVCGGHGDSHRALDILPRDDAREEIVRSTSLLQDHLGEPVVTFAYPHGYYDGTIRRLVQAAGCTSACGVKHALSAMHDDCFALARIIVDADTDMGRFAGLLSGRGLSVAPVGGRIQARGWQLIRRVASLLDRDLPATTPPAQRSGSQ